MPLPDAEPEPSQLDILADLIVRALELADDCDLPDIALRLEQARLSLIQAPHSID